MHTAFTFAVVGLLASILGVCKAQHDAKKCFIHVNDTGDPYDANFFYPDRAFPSLQQCSSSSAFCSSLLRTSIEPTTTIEVYKVVTRHKGRQGRLPVYTETKFKTVFTATETVGAGATLTVASSTSTVSECSLTNSIVCGAVTFDTIAHDIGDLTQGCKCILNQSTLTTTLQSPVFTYTAQFRSTSVVSVTVLTTKYVTTTKTATTSVDVATVRTCRTLQKPPHNCHNHGTQWAYYPILADDVHGTPDNLTAWDPAVYKSRTPDLKGATNLIGDLTGEYYEYGEYIYGTVVQSMDDMAVIFRGYIFAEQNGTYSFTVGDVVDIALVWVGNVAYSGWNLSNAVAFREFGTMKVDLEAGKYHPFRVAWGLGTSTYYENKYGLCDEETMRCGYFYFHITRPDGVVVVGFENHKGYADYRPSGEYAFADEYFESPNVMLQFSCDGTSAPKFQPYGHET